MRLPWTAFVRCTAIALTAALSAVVALPVAEEAEAAFPGRDGLIAFSAELRFGGPPRATWEELYTVRRTGRGLTFRADAPVRAPVWSPDGTRLVATDVGGGYGDHRLVIVDLNGMKSYVPQPDYSWTQPTWSADGQRIAFVRYTWPGDPGGLWSVNPDGTDLRLITDAVPYPGEPAWSPTGDSLLFVSRSSGHEGLWKVGPDGGGLERIVAGSVSEPDWSPDAEHIVYTEFLGSESHLVVARADGSEATRIQTPAGASSPTWSPSGRYIAFRVTTESGDSEIWKMRRDGRQPRLVIGSTAEWRPTTPVWQPIPR